MRFMEQEVEVLRKPIRRMHLYVLPPEGRLRVTAPLRQPVSDIQAFLNAKGDWIQRKQAEVRARAETARALAFSERPYLGKTYPVRFLPRMDRRRAVSVAFDGDAFTVSAPRAWAEAWSGASPVLPDDAPSALIDDAFDAFYRDALFAAAPPVIARWSQRTGKTIARWQPRRMRTRWGSMNVRTRSLTLSVALMKKPLECLEYVVAHEFCHLFVPNHSSAFYAALTRFLPDWRERRALLNDRGAR